jgi:hypothetical protein
LLCVIAPITAFAAENGCKVIYDGGSILAIQCDKSDYRGVLAGIEGITGKKAVDSEALTVKN